MASPRKRRERKAARAAEAQKAEAPKAEAPKAEAPKKEAPKKTQEAVETARASKKQDRNPAKSSKGRIKILGNKND
jgi:hypothetical protein